MKTAIAIICCSVVPVIAGFIPPSPKAASQWSRTRVGSTWIMKVPGHSNITSVSVAFTDWHDGEGDEINGTDLNTNHGATMYMLLNVPAGGTFTKPAALPDKRGQRYVPESWNVVDKEG